VNYFEVPYRYPARSVVVDGYRIAYVDVNPDAEETVVFLHDVAGDLDDFADVYEAVSRDRRAIGVDLVGFGKSDKPPIDDPVALNAALLEGLLDALDVERASLVGHGYGATVAAALAAARPSRVDRLVLSAPFGARELDARALATAAHRFDFDVLTALEDDTRRHWYEAAVAGWNDRLERQLAVRDDLAQSVAYRQWARAVEKASRSALEDPLTVRLAEVTAPTLVVWGADDPVAPFADAARVRDAVAGARLVAIEECGHMPTYEQPEAFVAAVTGFLGEGAIGAEAPPPVARATLDVEPWPGMTPAVGRLARMLLAQRERLAGLVVDLTVDDLNRRPVATAPSVGELAIGIGARIARVYHEVLRAEPVPGDVAARYAPEQGTRRIAGRVLLDVGAALDRLAEWLAVRTDADLNRTYATERGAATLRAVLWEAVEATLLDCGRIAAMREALDARSAPKTLVQSSSSYAGS
jgi:pimeloyl-ACP methyl ester carboxylesterase